MKVGKHQRRKVSPKALIGALAGAALLVGGTVAAMLLRHRVEPQSDVATGQEWRDDSAPLA